MAIGFSLSLLPERFEDETQMIAMREVIDQLQAMVTIFGIILVQFTQILQFLPTGLAPAKRRSDV